MKSTNELNSKLQDVKARGNAAFKAGKFKDAMTEFDEAITLWRENIEVFKIEQCFEFRIVLNQSLLKTKLLFHQIQIKLCMFSNLFAYIDIEKCFKQNIGNKWFFQSQRFDF